jgi:hypothetical protein
MLDYVALGLLFFVFITLVYGIVAIHDIPYGIAKARHHPHQDAIHIAGWVSLFTLHVLWPFLFIWATIYRPDRGWGVGGPKEAETTPDLIAAVARLEARVAELEGEARRKQSMGGEGV